MGFFNKLFKKFWRDNESEPPPKRDKPKKKAVRSSRKASSGSKVANASRTKDKKSETPKSIKKTQERPKELRIGIDFGTSYSKVVIGGEVPIGYEVIKSPFNNEKCLFESCLFSDKKKKTFSLEPKLSAHKISGIKIDLINKIEKSEEVSAITASKQFKLCAIYLSLIVKHSQSYFKENRDDLNNRYDFVWGLTLGFPSTPSSDGYKMCEHVFKILAEVSLLIAHSELNPNFKLVERFITCKEEKKKTFKSIVQTEDWAMSYPEILSQVVALNNPDLQINGQQILVDIGAGTVDAVFFSKHFNVGDIYSIYDAEVKFNGAHKLHEFRIKELKTNFPGYSFSGTMPNDVSDSSPYDFKNYKSNKISKKNLNQSLQSFDKKFLGRVESHVFGLFKRVFHECLEPVYSGQKSFQNQSFHLILSGGGSHLTLYKKIKDFPYHSVEGSKVTLQVFPMPEKVSGLSDSEKKKFYNRLSVAFGLAVQPINLPEIRTQVMEGKTDVNPPRVRPKSNMCVSCKKVPPIPGTSECYECSR